MFRHIKYKTKAKVVILLVQIKKLSRTNLTKDNKTTNKP